MRPVFSFVLFISVLLFFLRTQALDRSLTNRENPLSAQVEFLPANFSAEQIIELRAQLFLPDGYRAYLDKFKVSISETDGVDMGFGVSKLHIEPLVEFYDKFSKTMKKGVKGKATLTVAVKVPKNLQMPKILSPSFSDGKTDLMVKIHYQACTDTYCLFPQIFENKIPVSLNSAPSFIAPSSQPISFFNLSFEDVFRRGLVWTFLFVFLFGVLTSFTPCIFPMIPITLAILGKDVHAHSRWQTVIVSHVYVFGIAITYAVLGLIAASTGTLFGSLMSSPLVLGFVCVVFLTMSVSMFGFFEIAAPLGLQNSLARLRLKGYSGAFLTGIIAGLVASPCVGPVLVGILTFVARSQNLWLGFWILFTYALGLGQLFLLLGFSSRLTRKLPRTGSWMNGIKKFFALLMLGAFFYYLNLLASPFISRYWSHYWPQNRNIESKNIESNSLNWIQYSEANFNLALKNGKPIIIDFYADWCAACKELEQNTFAHPQVKALASDFVFIKFDATTESPDLTKLRERYSLVGLPAIIFISSRGVWLKELTLTEYEDPLAFRKRMDRAR